MVTIQSEKAKDYELYSLLYQIHSTNDKILFFEKKYGLKLNEYEGLIKSSEKENFEAWDDYLEWKANIKALEYLLSQKKDIENGNYTFA